MQPENMELMSTHGGSSTWYQVRAFALACSATQQDQQSAMTPSPFSITLTCQLGQATCKEATTRRAGGRKYDAWKPLFTSGWPSMRIWKGACGGGLPASLPSPLARNSSPPLSLPAIPPLPLQQSCHLGRRWPLLASSWLQLCK